MNAIVKFFFCISLVVLIDAQKGYASVSGTEEPLLNAIRHLRGNEAEKAAAQDQWQQLRQRRIAGDLRDHREQPRPGRCG